MQVSDLPCTNTTVTKLEIGDWRLGPQPGKCCSMRKKVFRYCTIATTTVMDTFLSMYFLSIKPVGENTRDVYAVSAKRDHGSGLYRVGLNFKSRGGFYMLLGVSSEQVSRLVPESTYIMDYNEHAVFFDAETVRTNAKLRDGLAAMAAENGGTLNIAPCDSGVRDWCPPEKGASALLLICTFFGLSILTLLILVVMVASGRSKRQKR